MIDFGGLKLKNPVVIASGPCSATIEQLEAAARAGAAGASIKQVMTRQTFRGNLRACSVPDHVKVFPSTDVSTWRKASSWCEAKRRKLDMAIIVNLSSQELTSRSTDACPPFEQVGADAIESTCTAPTSASPRQLGRR